MGKDIVGAKDVASIPSPSDLYKKVLKGWAKGSKGFDPDTLLFLFYISSLFFPPL